MTLVREAGTQPVAQFTVPYRGTWNSVAANQLSPDTLYSSSNVFIREGKLRNRPGLALLNSTVFANRVVGGAMAVTPTDKVLLAVTKDALYTLRQSDSTWNIDTEAAFANLSNMPVDITFMETASQYVAILASEGRQPKAWVQGSGATEIAPVTAAIPMAKSVCTSARRIVFLVPPHTIKWTKTLTYNDLTTLTVARIAQTNDVGICVRSLSNLAFAVYKERSIYVARAQAGSDATAFAFAEPLIVEGPASVHAVVIIGGMHMYMTRNGRVAIFDGTRYPQWILDGLWLYLQDDIDPEYAHTMFGVFDYRLHTVTFHYARNGDNGAMYGAVIINVPLSGSGVDSYAGFMCTFSKPVSYGYERRFNNSIDRSVLFTHTAGDMQSFNFDEDTLTDDGATFTCSMQTPLIAMPDMNHHQVSMETFLERSNGYGHVDVAAVTSDALENAGGTVDVMNVQRIDLNNNPVREYIGFNVMTRFFGLKYTWTSSSKVRYAGCNVYGRVLS